MINLYFLRYFLDTTHLGSLTKAAQKNFVSPAAVSSAIKKLEEHFSISLLKHAKNSLVITSQGRKLAVLTEQLFEQVTSLEQQMGRPATDGVSTLQFATVHSLGTSLLPSVLEKARIRLPQATLNFRFADPLIIESWLEREVVDFAISLVRKRNQNITHYPFYEGEFVLVRRRGHKPGKTLQRLISDTNWESAEFMRLYKSQYGKDLAVGMYVQSWEVMKAMVDSDDYEAFIPDYLFSFAPGGRSQYVIRRIPFPYPRYTLAVFMKNTARNNQAVDVFLEVLRDTVGSS